MNLRNKFQTRFAVTKRLKATVEDLYAKPPKPTTAKECCHIDKSTLEYDELFRTKVDLNNICLKISGAATQNPRHLDAEKISREMRDIHIKNPFIKWQYFASVEGVYTGFPVFDDLAPCDLYDPRYRPFYVETATPEAKDVVLVIDSSASMTGKKFTIAKEAAKTVLQSLNPKISGGSSKLSDFSRANWSRAKTYSLKVQTLEMTWWCSYFEVFFIFSARDSPRKFNEIGR